MKCRKFMSLFGGVVAMWSLATHAQESATMGTTKASTATSPRIEVARVKERFDDFASEQKSTPF
jgi:hypothetical protein